MHPAATRAAVQHRHNAPLTLETLPLPAVIEPGAALVRITCATLCGTDAEIWSGRMSFPDMLPIVPGHEMVGQIIAAGAGCVDALGVPLAVGDRIGWSESTCGHCHGCTILREPVACENRGYGFLQRADRPPFATGGLSEYVYVTPGAAKLKLPADVPDPWASMAGCAAKTVLRAIDRAGAIRPGSAVVVQGAGALGLFATAALRIAGAGLVVTIGAPQERLALARVFGADLALDIRQGFAPAHAQVMEATGGLGAEVVFDFAGARGVGMQALAMAGQRGRVVIVGSTSPDPSDIGLGEVMRKEISVIGSLNGDIADYARAIGFFRAFRDRMPWDRLFAPPVGLSGASAALEALHRQEIVKPVIDPRLP